MSITPSHNFSRPYRRLAAKVMTVLYVLVLLGPLAPFTSHSAGGSLSLARECSGDCSTCGCSPESRTAHTCCCAKKRMQQKQAQLHDHVDGEADEPECCKNEHAESRKAVIACGCPCENGKPAAITSVGTSEVLPSHFTESFSISHTDTLFSPLTHHLTSRHSEPPDPPPKLV